MKRWLYADHPVAADRDRVAEALRRDVRELLRRATDTADDEVAGDGSFLLRLSGQLNGMGLAKNVRVSTGVATTVDRVERRFHLPLQWHADPARPAFPAFDGAIELAPLAAARTDLVLVGTYTPPLGPVGAVLDAAALRIIADGTAERLVTALGRAISERLRPDDGSIAPDEVLTPASALTVRDLMTHEPLVLDEDMPLRAAALLLHHHGIHGAPVVDREGGLIGVLSEADLLEKEAAPVYGWRHEVDESWRRRDALTVGEACSRPARVTAPEATVHDAARTMLDAHVGRLVVIDDARVAGILARSDVLRALLRADAELQAAVDEVLEDLDEPEVQTTVQWGGATLQGRVSRLSRVAGVVERIRAVDGVLWVDDSQLAWIEDDVTPIVPLV